MTGPMARAYTTVPRPAVPPRIQPTASTVISIPVRTTRTDQPVRA
ncbi:hypothetical protein ACFQ0O_36130 [Saccharopolyspora spinosporotrichia]